MLLRRAVLRTLKPRLSLVPRFSAARATLNAGRQQCDRPRWLHCSATLRSEFGNIEDQSGIKRAEEVQPSGVEEERWLAGAALVQRNLTSIGAEQILNALKTARGKLIRDPGQTVSVSFFLTKHFANLAADEHFLREALTRVLHFTGNPKKPFGEPLNVDLIVAVVDAIPLPGFTYVENRWDALAKPNTNAAKEASKKIVNGDPAEIPPVHDQGQEGLAYTISAGSRDAQVGTNDKLFEGSPPRSSPNTKNMNPDTLATITFDLKESANGKSSSQYVKLALAKTIFYNGLPHTLFSSTWVENKGTERYELVKQESLQHASVTIPLVRPPPAQPMQRQRSFMSIPLIPLTPPREVIASMGNIVRQIGGTDVPASQELETAVVQFFEDNNMPVQAAAVWALIVPEATVARLKKERSLDLMERGTLRQRQQKQVQVTLSKNELLPRDIFSSVPYQLMLRGARLHKVLSGGGGWGKKAGLLSLDPESDYTSVDATAPSHLLDLDGILNEPAPVKTVTSPGDYIRFYIAPDLPAADFPEPHLDMRMWKQSRRQTLEFGVLPSSMDQMEQNYQEFDWSPKSENHNMCFMQRHFGAMSEGGMSIRTTDVSGNQWMQSKVGVPYARFSYQSYGGKDRGNERLIRRQHVESRKERHADRLGPANTNKNIRRLVLDRKEDENAEVVDEVAQQSSEAQPTLQGSQEGQEEGIPLNQALQGRISHATLTPSIKATPIDPTLDKKFRIRITPETRASLDDYQRKHPDLSVSELLQRFNDDRERRRNAETTKSDKVGAGTFRKYDSMPAEWDREKTSATFRKLARRGYNPPVQFRAPGREPYLEHWVRSVAPNKAPSVRRLEGFIGGREVLGRSDKSDDDTRRMESEVGARENDTKVE